MLTYDIYVKVTYEGCGQESGNVWVTMFSNGFFFFKETGIHQIIIQISLSYIHTFEE